LRVESTGFGSGLRGPNGSRLEARGLRVQGSGVGMTGFRVACASMRRRRVAPATPRAPDPRAPCPRSIDACRYSGGASPPAASLDPEVKVGAQRSGFGFCGFTVHASPFTVWGFRV
jgi:hypothetical protein